MYYLQLLVARCLHRLHILGQKRDRIDAAVAGGALEPVVVVRGERPTGWNRAKRDQRRCRSKPPPSDYFRQMPLDGGGPDRCLRCCCYIREARPCGEGHAAPARELVSELLRTSCAGGDGHPRAHEREYVGALSTQKLNQLLCGHNRKPRSPTEERLSRASTSPWRRTGGQIEEVLWKPHRGHRSGPAATYSPPRLPNQTGRV